MKMKLDATYITVHVNNPVHKDSETVTILIFKRNCCRRSCWPCLLRPSIWVRGIAMSMYVCMTVCESLRSHISNKNSSGDEIANVNFYAVRPESGKLPNSLK